MTSESQQGRDLGRASFSVFKSKASLPSASAFPSGQAFAAHPHGRAVCLALLSTETFISPSEALTDTAGIVCDQTAGHCVAQSMARERTVTPVFAPPLLCTRLGAPHTVSSRPSREWLPWVREQTWEARWIPADTADPRHHLRASARVWAPLCDLGGDDNIIK